MASDEIRCENGLVPQDTPPKMGTQDSSFRMFICAMLIFIAICGFILIILTVTKKDHPVQYRAEPLPSSEIILTENYMSISPDNSGIADQYSLISKATLASKMVTKAYDVNECEYGAVPQNDPPKAVPQDSSFRSFLCAMLIFIAICGIILIALTVNGKKLPSGDHHSHAEHQHGKEKPYRPTVRDDVEDMTTTKSSHSGKIQQKPTETYPTEPPKKEEEPTREPEREDDKVPHTTEMSLDENAKDIPRPIVPATTQTTLTTGTLDETTMYESSRDFDSTKFTTTETMNSEQSSDITSTSETVFFENNAYHSTEGKTTKYTSNGISETTESDTRTSTNSGLYGIFSDNDDSTSTTTEADTSTVTQSTFYKLLNGNDDSTSETTENDSSTTIRHDDDYTTSERTEDDTSTVTHSTHHKLSGIDDSTTETSEYDTSTVTTDTTKSTTASTPKRLDSDIDESTSTLESDLPSTPTPHTTKTDYFSSTTTETTTDPDYDEVDSLPHGLNVSSGRVCESGYCKTAATNILSLLDHKTNDTCSSFYQFACGSTTKFHGVDEDEVIWDILQGKVDQPPESYESRIFKEFYDHCVSHGDTYNQTIRLDKVRNFLNGSGYGILNEGDQFDSNTFNRMVADMILIDSVPYFEVKLDFKRHPKNYQQYSMQIKLKENTLDSDGYLPEWSAYNELQQRCLNKQLHRTHRELINMDEIYFYYKQCLNQLLESFLNSAENILKEMHYVADYQVIRFDLEETLQALNDIAVSGIHIETDSRQFEPSFPIDPIAKVPLFKWDIILTHLIGSRWPVTKKIDVQNLLSKELSSIFRNGNSMKSYHNMFFTLFLMDLYKNYVYTKTDQRFCLKQASQLFPDIASDMYHQAVASKNFDNQKAKTNELFRGLVHKFTDSLDHAKWIANTDHDIGHIMARTKINLLFYSKNGDDRYTSLEPVSSYFDLIRIKQFSKRQLYKLDGKQFFPSHMFTYFVKTFDKNPKTFYAGDYIAVPTRLVVSTFEDPIKPLPKYIVAAKLGQKLAKEFSRHFDPVWIQAINISKDAMDHYKKYVTDVQDLSSELDSRHIYILGRQELSFKINGQLSVNERISDGSALNMITSYAFENITEDQILPYTGSELSAEKIFFVVVAQEHCKRLNALEFTIQLHESPVLPPQISVDTALKNSTKFQEVFHCGNGSPMNYDTEVYRKIQFPLIDDESDNEYYDDVSV